MTFKKFLISAFIAAILSIVIRSILRANGIHNFLSEHSIGQVLLYLVIFSLCYLFFKRQSDK
jgi:cytochrome c oxidase assembly factor CtaG